MSHKERMIEHLKAVQLSVNGGDCACLLTIYQGSDGATIFSQIGEPVGDPASYKVTTNECGDVSMTSVLVGLQ